VDDKAFARTRDGKPRVRTWAANPELFPCELSEETLRKAKKAVQVRGTLMTSWQVPGTAEAANGGTHVLQPPGQSNLAAVALDRQLSSACDACTSDCLWKVLESSLLHIWCCIATPMMDAS
jgi:hypothetical protein